MIKEKQTEIDPQEFIKDGQRGMARLCRQLFSKEFIFNHTNNVWHYYQNGYWKEDNMKQVRKYVSGELSQIIEKEYTRISAMYEKADREDKKMIKPLMEETGQCLKSLGFKSYIDNVMELASSELPATEHLFDRNPFLFICGNGVYDLNQNEFKPHSPSYMISKMPTADYDPQADCPKWHEFLNTIFQGRKELIDYIQIAVGYSLSGLKDFQGFFFCYGQGANGKSTFFNVLKLIMQDYYQSFPVDSLLTKNQTGTDYNIANLKGARLVLSSEIPEGKKLNEALIKDLTGGDTISARRIYGQPFQFEPTHKLWMFGNHKPIISGDDHGIWRRVHLIPFEYKFSKESRRNTEEVMNEFKAELSGILNWCLQGFNLFIEHGLDSPEIVKNEVQKYKNELNSISAWFEIRCLESEENIDYTNLYMDYSQYCDVTGAFQQSKIKFSKYLESIGKQIVAGYGNKRIVMGLKLKDEGAKNNSAPF
jgi:putative DNA primase/helicase